ncbi:cytochrome P450 [Lentinula raphanica]|nr:cytochrome P450 [Lentinula raphanica]
MPLVRPSSTPPCPRLTGRLSNFLLRRTQSLASTDPMLFYLQLCTLASVALAFALWIISPIFMRRLITDADGNRVPPGPSFRYFFLRKYPERALLSWASKYGHLFSIWMGTQLFVVVSDPRMARDLLVTNGAIFSSRKRYFMKNQTILAGRAITASEYGETWRHHRKLAMQLLTPKAIESYAQSLNYEAHILVRTLMEDGRSGRVPLDTHHYAGRFALNNMLLISFGIRTDNTEDPLIARALQLAMEFMDLTGPWSNVIDFIEPLQKIPTKTRSRGRKLYSDLIEVYGTMILRVQAKLDAGEFVPECLVKTLIQNKEKEKLDWVDLCMLSAVFTLGGVHSSSGIIQWFLALIPSHPEIARRAQEELDRVVGRERLPTAEDEPNLPYVRAIIKEVQRVHAPFWIATPHFTTEDFTYEGQYIPKGTAVVLDCYTLHHNPERYEKPWEFNPDRYLGDNLSCAESSKLSNVMERDHWAFGAGRRICPGMQVAERELWLAVSQLLWSFNFRALPDEPISLEEYEGLSGRTPLPFRIRLQPRHQLVEPALKGVQEVSHWTL